MAHCVQSATVKSACQRCGGRAEKMHQPVFVRGTFCPKCCPACRQEAANAPAPTGSPQRVVVRTAVRRRDRPTQANAQPARGATQWIDAGWGHRPDDPWVHDRDRHAPEGSRWIPRRPDWFRNARTKPERGARHVR